ncbi:hypothetical protein TNCV_1945181 [Trichonephila clavipes]|nr:hypothetical protein TNCV_1945181 [Trichonephila clavipes]
MTSMSRTFPQSAPINAQTPIKKYAHLPGPITANYNRIYGAINNFFLSSSFLHRCICKGFTYISYLCIYSVSLVYADKPQTLDHLEDNIRQVIADIRPQMLEKIIEYWTARLDYIRASRGNPMPEIIFKTYNLKNQNLIYYPDTIPSTMFPVYHGHNVTRFLPSIELQSFSVSNHRYVQGYDTEYKATKTNSSQPFPQDELNVLTTDLGFSKRAAEL